MYQCPVATTNNNSKGEKTVLLMIEHDEIEIAEHTYKNAANGSQTKSGRENSCGSIISSRFRSVYGVNANNINMEGAVYLVCYDRSGIIIIYYTCYVQVHISSAWF